MMFSWHIVFMYTPKSDPSVQMYGDSSMTTSFDEMSNSGLANIRRELNAKAVDIVPGSVIIIDWHRLAYEGPATRKC
jgi:hypothetical protein